MQVLFTPKYVYMLVTVTGPCAFSTNSSPKLFCQGELTQTLVCFAFPLHVLAGQLQ